MVGPGNGAAGAGAGVTVGNVGNGVESDNNAIVNMNNTTALTQFNDAAMSSIG